MGDEWEEGWCSDRDPEGLGDGIQSPRPVVNGLLRGGGKGLRHGLSNEWGHGLHLPLPRQKAGFAMSFNPGEPGWADLQQRFPNISVPANHLLKRRFSFSRSGRGM